MKDKLNQMLDQKPPVKGKPLSLSTEAPTDEIAQSHNRIIAPTQQLKPSTPKRTKRGYAFREDLVKACKQIALDSDRLLYEVMEEALVWYLEGKEDPRLAALEAEVKQLKERLDIETRYRQDTEVRHFKAWIRNHTQPTDTGFLQTFLLDTRLPQHASRSLYEAKLRAAGYSDEEIALFQSAWKDMLFSAAQ